MRTLRSAAILLSSTTCVECTGPLLVELGFRDDLVSLDKETRQRLGLGDEIDSASMSLGPGSMRALVGSLSGPDSARDTVARLASRLTSRTPHILWVLILLHRSAGQIVIGSWYSSGKTPRVVALVAIQNAIVDSDSETLCALAAAATGSDIATHSRWLEILGRETVSRNFFRAMQSCVEDLAHSLAPIVPLAPATELALLYLSRLLFLSFIETKSWMDGDHAFLANRFADCMVQGGRYHRRVLTPLFFGTLNTKPINRASRAERFGKIPFLNGGLFARSLLERKYSRCEFSDEAIGDVFGHLLTRFRFTAREDSSGWSEAAVDPEMLGKAFESLMVAPDRKATGAFYTPQTLVEQVATSAIVHAIAGNTIAEDAVVAALGGEIPGPAIRESILESIERLHILDPACGSGAFLVHALERLASLRVHLGDGRPMHSIRRDILTRSIFGVDLNPTAVWLCELRLWLSMAIEDPESDPMRVTALPNLDRNIRIGDSLSGGSFQEAAGIPRSRRITTLRARYSRTAGRRKNTLARMLDRLERECAVANIDVAIVRAGHERRELLVSLRSPDLFGERLHSPADRARLIVLRNVVRAAQRARRLLTGGGALPFLFSTQFADVGAAGGFDIVIGNPPWVRIHNVEAAARERLSREFVVFRESAWQAGADAAAAGRGFSSQVDLAALFLERSVSLTRDGGIVALLVPAKLWRSLAGGGIRSFLARETSVAELHDLTLSPQMFDAAVYPSVIVARRGMSVSFARSALAVVHRKHSAIHWQLEPSRLPFDTTPGSPWLIIPTDVRSAFDRVSSAGVPLADRIGRPMLGVKTGCNEAFVVRVRASETSEVADDAELTAINSAEATGRIEKNLLRPLHRGESIRPWRLGTPREQIIWTHGNCGPLAQLPPHARRWLLRWQTDLEQRTDARGRSPWWTIFRTESAGSSAPRVAWSDFGRCPRAAVVHAGDPTVLLNSCYVVRCRDATDAYALAAVLNSPIAAAWLNALAEPARGGYCRYLGWTVALLPLPADWVGARRILAPIAERAANGEPPGADLLLGAALAAYRLVEKDVEPLLLWNSR